MTLIKCVVLIPLRRNDGSAVSRGEMRGILNRFLREFGGFTVAGEVVGGWRSPEGVEYRDRNTQVWVIVESSQLPTLRETVREIGRQLGQEAMYLEVSEAKVDFLSVRGNRGRGKSKRED